MAYLIARGPHGRRVLELKPVTIVGRASDSDLVLRDPLASKRHFELRETDGQWRIADLGSTNGTLVDGQAVSGATVLHDGDEIVVGDESMVFTLALPASGDDAAQSTAIPAGALSVPVERLGLALPDMSEATLVAAPGSPLELSVWLRGLYRLLRVAHLAQSEDDLLKLIHASLRQTLPGTRIGIVLEPAPGASGAHPLADKAVKPPLSPAMSRLLKFARERCVAVLSPDISATPENNIAGERTSLLIAPLLSGRQTLGYLCFEHPWQASASGDLALAGQGPLTQAHLDYAAAVAYPMASLLENLRRTQATLAENQRLRHEAGAERQIAGQSRALKDALAVAERIAPAGSSVLIFGESGTGKELVARAIHAQSPRRAGPFVALNCGALPPGLLESELFGHARGAFTGAAGHREGCFESASGGTLFLDEIGELPLEAQTRLLRVLQESAVVRVGESHPRPVDCRIIAATHRDLEADIKSERFREDLYYRLKVVDISLPPLRMRIEDLPLLCEHLLRPFGQFRLHPDTLALLRKHRWPGNVRELRNVLERMAVLARPLGQAAAGVITLMPEDIPLELRRAIEGGQPGLAAPPRPTESAPAEAAVEAAAFSVRPERILPLDPLQMQYARWVVRQCGGNKSKAAKVLGIQRATLYTWLERSDESESTP